MRRSLFVVVVLFLLCAANAFAEVCPPGNVKFEVDPQAYEYTDGSGTIVADSQTVSWYANDGFKVVSVCVKIGGPGGGTLVYPNVTTPPFVSYTYGVSHVVLTTQVAPPTAVVVREFRAQNWWTWLWSVWRER